MVFYIPEDGILHSHRRENINSYIDNYLFAVPEDFLEILNFEERS
jgi:hypothetical protein